MYDPRRITELRMLINSARRESFSLDLDLDAREKVIADLMLYKIELNLLEDDEYSSFLENLNDYDVVRE